MQPKIEQSRYLKSLGYGPSHAIPPIFRFEGPVQHVPYELDEDKPCEFPIPTMSDSAFCEVSPSPSPSDADTTTDAQKLGSASVLNMPAAIQLTIHFVLHLLSGQRRQNN